MRQLLVLILLLPLAAANAQIRYHFGDDPRWADPNFDDSSWRSPTPGKFPMPIAEGAKGMVWLRYRVAVPPDQSPLAIRLARENGTCTPGEFWVNGVRAGSQGRFPPAPLTLKVCETNVFDLPQGAARPGETAVVAWRGWIQPIFATGVEYLPPVLFGVEIGPRDWMRSRQNEVRAHERLAAEPDFVLYLLQLLIGVCLLAIWWRTQTQVLLWFAAFVLLWSAYGLLLMHWTMGPGSTHMAYWTFNLCVWMAFYLALIQFMKCVLAPPRWAIVSLRIICVPWLAITWIPVLWVEDTPVSRLVCSIGLVGGVSLGILLFLGHIALTTWFVFRGRPDTRGLAISLFLAGITYLLVDNLGIATRIGIGGFQVLLDNLGTTLVILAMGYQLLWRLWLDWRQKEERDAEFEAAREMQEALVQRLPDTPGFRMESAYRPASQVGGDFYRIFPADEGAVLVVVGDVSGKGLKAAMTVAGLVCAMEAIRTRRPGAFLEELNHAAKGYLQSGFATCCVVLIQPSGEAILANAGHLAPYADGRELEVEAGLPLGIADGVEYPESITRGERFTFVSDGVVEAANAKGDLFGFDRTREISGQSAQEIADAAQAWGQNDDVTVVTVRSNS